MTYLYEKLKVKHELDETFCRLCTLVFLQVKDNPNLIKTQLRSSKFPQKTSHTPIISQKYSTAVLPILTNASLPSQRFEKHLSYTPIQPHNCYAKLAGRSQRSCDCNHTRTKQLIPFCLHGQAYELNTFHLQSMTVRNCERYPLPAEMNWMSYLICSVCYMWKCFTLGFILQRNHFLNKWTPGVSILSSGYLKIKYNNIFEVLALSSIWTITPHILCTFHGCVIILKISDTPQTTSIISFEHMISCDKSVSNMFAC